MSARTSFPTGCRIAFTGRLASMSRAAVIRVITDLGGLFRDRVTHQTNFLVIGADGWPLRKSGSITRNLRRASELQEAGYAVSIIGEAEFLRRICDTEQPVPIRREHTLEQLSRLLGISGLKLRRWIDLGLIQPSNHTAISSTFDYQQVASAKTLAQLIARGVSPSKLANSLREMRRWLPDDHGIDVSIIALEKQLLVRDGDELMDASGQLHFSFEDQLDQSFITTPANSMVSDDPDTLFDRAYQNEKRGHTEAAIECYTDWLKHFGEDHEVLFNVANVYLNVGRIEQAIGFFYRCTKTEPTYARAWNNLGLCLHQSGETSAAIEAMRRSVVLDPENVDTLFNLADMLDEAGSESEARLMWLRIARLRSDGDVTLYAMERIENQP